MERLTEVEKARFRRQIDLKGFGEKAQRRLKDARVGVLGVGGLGSPAALYLAAAGVGELVLADDQVVELSNLNRQILHWEKDVHGAQLKVESAMEKLTQFNTDLRVRLVKERVSADNLTRLMGDADVILDCTDNFDTRMELNGCCVAARKPFVHGAVEGMHGQLTTIIPGRTPCLRCLFAKTATLARETPVVGAAAGFIGSLQASEAIKLITGFGEPLASRLLVVDLECNSFEVVPVERDEKCPVCSK
ncbi:MAG TPA: HesA/MoeB/ThiF family protein [Methanomassiliicoccales archaeon]|nr:HesA/MoeB/ThiF family protein [Methanomassiliicoccales archaeon]